MEVPRTASWQDAAASAPAVWRQPLGRWQPALEPGTVPASFLRTQQSTPQSASIPDDGIFNRKVLSLLRQRFLAGATPVASVNAPAGAVQLPGVGSCALATAAVPHYHSSAAAGLQKMSGFSTLAWAPGRVSRRIVSFTASPAPGPCSACSQSHAGEPAQQLTDGSFLMGAWGAWGQRNEERSRPLGLAMSNQARPGALWSCAVAGDRDWKK